VAKGTRQRIVDAAVELFNAEGVGPVTTNHIAAHLGISPGNLYYHFANKEEIIREVWAQMNAAAETAWGSLTPPARGGKLDPAALQGVVVANLDLFGHYMFFARELPSLLRADEVLRESYRTVADARMAQLEDALASLAKAGLLLNAGDREDLRELAETAWMIGLFCVPHAETLDASPPPKNAKQRAQRVRAAIERGALLVLRQFKPYMDPLAYTALVVLVRSELNK
jgi:AcrR family transcriptional regulator